MAEFDLTGKIGQYLDRHLVFPLLEFLSVKGIYDKNELLQVKLDILNKTNMLDYAIDIRRLLYPSEEPESLKARRNVVVQTLQELQNEASVVVRIMSDENTRKQMETMRDSKTLVSYLQTQFDFKLEMMDVTYRLAKYRYECGNYSNSTSYLYFYMLVMPPTDKNYLNVMWGKLASEILLQNWDTALEDLNKLRDFIDGNNFSSLQLLQQRTWLIHWSLFVFFNHPKGRDNIIDMFLYRAHYLNAIQTMCPHILRYLATAVVINRSRRSSLKDLVKVIQQESYTYRDPITEFIEHLYVNFDFDGARQKLHECHTVLFNDFFLIACLEEFVENARLMIFETFCRIHQCISIGMLAQKLNMNPDEAECWIVNLIRNARLDAKIDSKLGHVVMGTQPASPYQQLVEKIDSLSVRSEALLNLIERKVKAKQESRWGAQDFY
ncbi:eukaryotic translation initiation factor 3 subunit, putative [Pediculus humanus corporis]|uniref:Eukaryotic translation initiation factor 3 subunit E n=1 Tax=Pediculus humanus subsp. corporis TaxID=121224 RepID=E0VAQ3_PEDHC|nr:eukaryotic translation initiation factor 3 subunit, putative [Pediculus humanus corporis]EEB10459.1 eukaryotic translation initiation factor 3 subunit, putative [Pediculus humanus corporis]